MRSERLTRARLHTGELETRPNIENALWVRSQLANQVSIGIRLSGLMLDLWRSDILLQRGNRLVVSKRSLHLGP